MELTSFNGGASEFGVFFGWLKSLSNESLILFSSNILFLAVRILTLSAVSLSSVSVCLSLVRTSPNSILDCSFWKEDGDMGTVDFFFGLAFVPVMLQFSEDGHGCGISGLGEGSAGG